MLPAPQHLPYRSSLFRLGTGQALGLPGYAGSEPVQGLGTQRGPFLLVHAAGILTLARESPDRGVGGLVAVHRLKKVAHPGRIGEGLSVEAGGGDVPALMGP